jgi:hypothetical protein
MKKKKNKNVVAFDGCRLKYFHTTTNQKHAAVINNGTKEGFKRQGAGRIVIPSFRGQSSWEGIKNKIKLMSLLIIFFSANLHY